MELFIKHILLTTTVCAILILRFLFILYKFILTKCLIQNVLKLNLVAQIFMSVSGETEAREMITFNIVRLDLKHRHKYIHTTHTKNNISLCDWNSLTILQGPGSIP